MMDTKQLEYILTIAEEKSLSRAAEKLFLSQSALSQQLAKLKSEGLPPLFYRYKGEMLLTDAGKIYINGARIIMKICDDTENLLNSRNDNHIDSLRLSVCRNLQPLVYTRLLPWLKHTYPNVGVSIRTPICLQMRRAVIDGEVDLAIFEALRNTNEILNYAVLREEEMVYVLPPDKQLYELQVILPLKGSHLRMICDQIGYIGHIFCEMDDISTALSLVKNIDCAAIVPYSSLKGIDLSVQRFSPAATFYTVAARRGGHDSAITREIIALLKTLLKEEDERGE